MLSIKFPSDTNRVLFLEDLEHRLGLYIENSVEEEYGDTLTVEDGILEEEPEFYDLMRDYGAYIICN